MARSDQTQGPDGINHYIPKEGGNIGTPANGNDHAAMQKELDDLDRRVSALEREQREEKIP
ncbi:MAG TPA: hypothetical protein VMB18_04190 [Terriglobales bacterium]|nr:hypothetical protein [Terriglobales bacterium]